MATNLKIDWWLDQWETLLPVNPESTRFHETVTVAGNVTTRKYSSTKTTSEDFTSLVEREAAGDGVARYTAGVALLSHAVALESSPRSDAMELCRWLGDLGLEVLAKKSEPVPELATYLAELLTRASEYNFIFPISKSITALLKAFDSVGQPPESTQYLQLLHDRFAGNVDVAGRRLAQKLNRRLSQGDEFPVVVNNNDAWGRLVNGRLGQYPKEKRLAWLTLLEHAQSAARAKPTKAWLKKATPLVAKLTPAELVAGLNQWIAQLGTEPIDPSNSDVLRGLAHSSALLPETHHSQVAAALADAAEAGCRRSTGGRLMCSKLSVAVIETLAIMGSRDAAGQLFRLKRSLNAQWIAEKIAPLCAAVAANTGVSEGELEEGVVPDLNFGNDGKLCVSAGEFTAELAFPRTSKGQLTWLDSQGKRRKTVPKTVKSDHSDTLTEAKRILRDAERIITSQRNRLDRSFVDRGHWSKDQWVTTHLQHPLVGVLSRRLIWSFSDREKTKSGIWHDNGLEDEYGRELDLSALPSEVLLWHPLGKPEAEVERWRNRMAELEICQPFRQAHREIYQLTDAERETNTYSNRFASHVLRHSQFRVLAQSREWKTPAIGQWDHGDVCATRHFRPLQIQAQLSIDRADGETESSGIYSRIMLDQIQFYAATEAALESLGAPGGIADPLPLDTIPPLLFSEAMRDVDLFVGVASVGNDPNWEDGGPRGRYRDYWYDYSFGELRVSASARREILESVIPRLKISDRCSFDRKFLIVRGDIRTYKIHLGSSNILMEPNDRYLCIVAGHGSRWLDKVFLPFEGDQRLSVILSKALMLAEDTKIKDPTILRQINLK